MDQTQRWSYLGRLDEELLLGGVILSEWCTFIVREADVAFVHGADLATILLCVSAVETHLRGEHASSRGTRLVNLINSSTLPADLKVELHALRKYRNKWVHIDDPWDDDELFEDAAQVNHGLEEFALSAVRVLRRTIYANPWI